MSNRRIEIYDTTLRDGTQGEGFNLSMQDKLLIAQKLDALGVDYIEGGFPLSNPKDAGFFREAQNIKFKNAKLAAFGMTRRRGMTAGDDPGIKALVDANTPVITIVGKSSEYHVTTVLGVTPNENLSMIMDTVKFLRAAGRQVVYDAEHFFDAWRDNAGYALQTILAAQEAGASVLSLCDTNGGSMPEWVSQVVAEVKKKAGALVGIHTHNDSAVAVANGMAAVNAGAGHVQGTINGVGERCGNMDLIAAIANLQLKYKFDCLRAGSLRLLTDTSRYVYDIANMNFISGQPYVGASAFAHKGGMHVHAVQKAANTYEHVQPESVGNTRKILVSELSGASNIAAKAGRKFDIENDKIILRKVLEKVQDLENLGWQFEAAEASFEMLLRKEINRYQQYFHLHHYRAVILKLEDQAPIAEATVKLRVKDQDQHTVAEGDGPVAALDSALRIALLKHYPSIEHVHLTDYKVRVINSKEETSASVRVVIEFKHLTADGQWEIFGTTGVSTNVIDASWMAVCDAYEYHLHHLADAAAQVTEPQPGH